MRTSITLCALTLCSALSAQIPPMAFDLADACRGGDGTFPGTGTMDNYPINTANTFMPAPVGYTFVVGTFTVLDSSPTDITDPFGPNPLQFDFSAYVGNTASNGGPANGLATGNLAINDPSLVGANPDYTGDPNNHSIMMCHASVGITFDLNAIRAVFPAVGWFVANAGSSCNATGYVILVDGELRAAGGGNSWNNFHALTVPISPTAQYLTLASTDNDSGSINCAHAFFGDPWLVPVPNGPAFGSLGGGCPNMVTGTPQLTNQPGSMPMVGTTFVQELTNTPGPSGGMLIVFGLFSVQYPLPLPLPNCQALVTSEAVLFVPYSNGLGTVNMTIPASPAVAGVQFFTQAGALDLAGGLGVSNANQAIIQ